MSWRIQRRLVDNDHKLHSTWIEIEEAGFVAASSKTASEPGLLVSEPHHEPFAQMITQFVPVV